MSSSYAELARKIIRDSIVSAIFIDDDIVEPFSIQEDKDQPQFTLSQNMYESFRKEGKSLDFYKFRKNIDWQEDREYLFNYRDLLILDWQLDKAAGFQQHETMNILKEAVHTDSLHFVSLYTAERERDDFSDIFYLLKSFFCGLYSPNFRTRFNEMIENLESEGIDTSFFNAVGGDFKRMTLARSSGKAESMKELKKKISDYLGDRYRIFDRFVKTAAPLPELACDIIGYCINQQTFGVHEEETLQVNTEHINDNFVVIKNTIIQIANKSNPGPGELFSTFTNAIQKVCGNILTLISLEIRSLLRKSSGFVGKDANSISDSILFHQNGKKVGFPDFLLGILRDQLLSHFDYKSGKLFAISETFWNGYKLERNVAELEAPFGNKKEVAAKGTIESKPHYNELLKLNVYYNELSLKKEEADILKFGDLFSCVNAFVRADGNFFLCITAHCDCLQPGENIKNNFYFIAGQRHPSEEAAIEERDGGHNSFIRFEGKNIAIKWESRPIVLKIPNNKINALTGTDGLDKPYTLVYVTTLKESYTQRMANNSFAFAMRVGIDFAAP